mmetsp:Transcript_52502/g.60049  ORF Transcript_52502/g.60049 Transcript_52502/m.60049 type:complete len:386 (+) Transcript_52502:690-1847(+)
MEGSEVQQVPGGGRGRSSPSVLNTLPKNILYLGAAGIVAFFLAIVFWIIAGTDDASKNANSWAEAVDKWNETDTVVDMEEINLDLDIVPSPKFDRVIDALKCKKDIQSTNQKVIDMNAAYPYDRCMFVFDNSTDVFFPTLVTDNRMLPTGNSTSRCLTLSWANNNEGRTNRVDIWKSYHPMTGFPKCQNYENQKTLWPDYVPQSGVDIQPWVQFDICRGRTDRKCATTCEKKGGFLFYQKQTVHKLSVTPEPICYGYKVLSKVCVAIEKVTDEDGDTIAWDFKGGCFKNANGGDPEYERFIPAEADKTYKLNDVKIYIVNNNDPYLTMLRATGDDGELGSDYTVIRVFGWIFFIAALGCLGAAGFLFYKQKQGMQGAGSQELVPK